MKITSGI